VSPKTINSNRYEDYLVHLHEMIGDVRLHTNENIQDQI